ncbi:MAG: LLM class flavin-dependent oxidoreductase [bacterium]|nr:LLM class flavin-dependent oxidoreductase [bacterium]
MKFGLFLGMHYRDVNRPFNDFLAEVTEMCQYAEELGFDAVFIPEHHFINYITNPSALALAIHIANHTKRLRLITAVIVLPYWHPLALAEEVALADHISNGRIELGVARGANKYEFDRLGLDIRESRDMSNESLDILLKALTEEDFEWNGKYWKFPEMTTLPRPLQKPHPPIWITAQSPDGLRGAAKRGLNVLTSPLYGCFADADAFQYALGEYEKALAETGTERKEFGILRRLYVGETREEAELQVRDVLIHWGMYMAFFERGGLDFRVDKSDVPLKRGAVSPARFDDLPLDNLYERYDDPILSDVEGVRKRVARWQEMGVTWLAANMAFGLPKNKVFASMERMARYVMPEFSTSAQPVSVRKLA